MDVTGFISWLLSLRASTPQYQTSKYLCWLQSLTGRGDEHQNLSPSPGNVVSILRRQVRNLVIIVTELPSRSQLRVSAAKRVLSY
jgi:hypothetical protein